MYFVIGVDQREYGPVSSDDVRAWIAQRRLSARSLARPDQTVGWRPLSDYRLVNVNGSENLYKAAQKASVHRFVHTSSHTVYGLGHGRFMTENDPLRPDPDPYSITKAEVTQRKAAEAWQLPA